MKTAMRVVSAFLLAVVFFCPVLARADSSIPANMAQLVGRAEAIVRVVCTSSTSEKRGALTMINSTFQVLETVKGSVPNPFTLSQWAFKGIPTYRVGPEVYWLFLAPGLNSTVGNEQGKFTVINDQVVNGRNNADLFEGGSPQGLSKAMSVGGISASNASGPIDQEAFKRMVNALQ